MQGWQEPSTGSTPNKPALATLALLGVLLASCMATNGGQGVSPSAQAGITDEIREVDLTPPPRLHMQTSAIRRALHQNNTLQFILVMAT